MDVSNRESAAAAGGTELIEQVVSLTGLPDGLVHNELDQILGEAGCTKENLTLEELRAAMLTYLESMQEQLEASEALEASAAVHE